MGCNCGSTNYKGESVYGKKPKAKTASKVVPKKKYRFIPKPEPKLKSASVPKPKVI